MTGEIRRHTERTGVVLIQVGTPDAPTAPALRRYLAQFLGDPRVVDVNPLIWKPILHGLILRTRPRKSAALYQRIWTDAGSPLLVHSRTQQAGVAARLGDAVPVELGMLVGEPSLEGALDRLADAGCDRIIALPLFPQYSSATCASAFDGIARWAGGRRDLPSLSFVRSFPDHPAFIEALRESVVEAGVDASPECPLLISYHGIPQRYADTGDPYAAECGRTTRALVAALGLPDEAWRVVYQSRFGREAWLQPYADETVAALPAAGIKHVAVVTPAFVADCLETIDEIGRELARSFTEAGGETFIRVPCINGSPAACDALSEIVQDVL